MIIFPPQKKQIGQDVLISTEFQLDSTSQNKKELWFKFPAREIEHISSDIDPFVVSLLLVAMQNREPIQIHGSLSEKLYTGIHNYQKVYNSWFPDRFKIVEIRPNALRTSPGSKTPNYASAFSGGVDSFFTFLSLLNSTTPLLSNTLFMEGFDMPLNLRKSIAELTSSYTELMNQRKMNFIVGSTNIRTFVNSVDWTNAHGTALAASALFFSEHWSHFFIPSSYTDRSYPKWGTHPELDPLLSTESLEFVHHGSELNRVEKLRFLSKFPETYPRLRVCWIQDIGLQNCGNCEKCIRTMIALTLVDSIDNYTTFKEYCLNGKKIRNLTQRTYQGRLFSKELAREAFLRGKFKIWFNLNLSLWKRDFLRKKRVRR